MLHILSYIQDILTYLAYKIVPVVVVLGPLVFFHELGHYLAARWRGVYVETFSIGFGRAIVSWYDRHGTQWRISWLPLGGYVKMHGQERPEEVSDEVRAGWKPGLTFHGKSVLSRAIIVAAGPAANFLLAMVVFAGLFMTVGRQTILPVISEVLPNQAAARAGLQVNDRIALIAGQPIHSFDDIQRIVYAHPNEALAVTVRRDGADVNVTVLTEAKEMNGHRIGRLGILGGTVAYLPMSVPDALLGGVTETWNVTEGIFGGLAQMLSGQRSTAELGGVLRIADMSSEVAKRGAPYLVSLIALLSVNLGLINLFPIPILDGGHLVFYAFEAVRGRPLPRRAQEYGFRAGLAVLAGLFIFATWNDVVYFNWVGKIAALFG